MSCDSPTPDSSRPRVDVTVELAPSAKYRRVIGDADDVANWPDAHRDAALAYSNAVGDSPAFVDVEVDDMAPLSWEMLTPTTNPEILETIATFFDGMDVDESTARLRAKCRLLDVGIYAEAEYAARQELR